MPKSKMISIRSIVLRGIIFILFCLGLYAFWALIPSENGVLQGATDETTTQFSIVSRKKNLICRVSEVNSPDKKIEATDSKEITIENTEFAVRKCYFTGLQENHNYNLEIIDGENNIVEKRSFGMLSTQKEELSIAVLSCTSDLAHNPKIWKSLLSKTPDLLLMIGDNVYADLYKSYLPQTQNHFWHRYVNTWRTLYLFQSPKLIPVLALWDDHDFGVNNGDSRNKDKDFTLFLYESFFAQTYPNSKLKKGPGASFSFRLGSTNLVFADGRYFRSVPLEKGGSFFSPTEVNWVMSELSRDPKVVNWIISGNQWFGSKFQEENFEHLFPEQFRHFLGLLNTQNVRYLLVSGDTHFSEVKKIGFEGRSLYEVTSSGMHSWPPGLLFPDERRIHATNLPNFTIGTLRNSAPEKIKFATFGMFGNEFFEVDIDLNQ